MQPEPRPIWVIGLNRSGTKWISNTLSNHDQVSAIRHEVHGGIVESPLLDIMPLVARDLAIAGDFERFIEVFSRSDYCQLSPLSADSIRALTPRPLDCLAVQGILGAQLAKEKGTATWLQKASPFNVAACLDHFPGARFVWIWRDIQDQLNASIKRSQQHGDDTSILRFVFVYVLGEKLRRSHESRENFISIRYEDLKADIEGVTRRVCAHVGLPYEERMIESRFAKNTAFTSDAERRKNLSAWDRTIISVSSTLFGLIPLSLLMRVHGLGGARHATLPAASQKLSGATGGT